jgi:predicted chitinase
MIAAVAAGRLELTQRHKSGQGSRHGLAPDTVGVSASEQPVALPITVALLQAAEPSNTAGYYAALVDAMNACASAYQVDTPLRVAHFLAQIGHESRFKAVEENGSYSPTRMREIFGCGSPARYDKQADECKLGAAARQRPKLWTDETTYAYQPANLLSYVYASRLANGDEASGDGYRYRGRGLIQLTFKANYAAFTATHKLRYPNDPQDFVADPDLLVTQRKYAVESAFFFWDECKVNEDADRDDLVAVTVKINGGTNGLDDRRLRLVQIKKAMGM